MDKKIYERMGEALFEQSVPDFSQFNYCVALDIGGGNCSMAVADLRPDQDNTPRLLRLDGRGNTSCWSNIGYDEMPGKEGWISIGEQSRRRNYHFSNYKIVPTDKNLELEVSPDNYVPTGDFLVDAAVRRTNRELTRDYIRMLFQSARKLEENVELHDKDKIMIIVGHPSSDDWKDKQAHNNLVEIVREATGVSTVLTTSESNAAILYALTNRSQISKANKILIVDLGAYSADITWIDRGNLNHSYSSMALGGKAIDKNVAQIILANSGQNSTELNQGYNLVYEARTVKEQFWPRGSEDQKTFVWASSGAIPVTITYKQFDKAVKEMPISIQDATTGQKSNLSYAGHLATFLESVKTEKKITQVDWVLVTGGAARMKPAMEVISSKAKALWNVQEENIWPSVISDSLVDESVPFGSLQFCLKSRDVLGSIPEVYDKLKKEAEKMVVPIARTVSEDVLNYLIPYAIEPVLRRFRDTEEIPTIEKLENALTIELNRDVHKDNIRKLADNAAKSKAMSNKEGFQKVITEFLEKLYDREAGDASWNWSTNIDLETVSDGSFTKAICQAVAKAMEDSVLEIVVGLMLVLTAILWVTVGFALEIVDGAKELWRKATWTEDQWAQWEREQEQKKLQAEQEKKQKELEERQKVRKPSERKKIYKKVIENQDTQSDLRYAVEKKVSEQLEGKCNENGFGVPEAYLEQLRVDICNAVYTGL